MEMGGVCGLLSRLVHIPVMYGMVMDGTHHVLLGGGLGKLLCVCQREAFAVRSLGRCPANRLHLEVRPRPHQALCVLG